MRMAALLILLQGMLLSPGRAQQSVSDTADQSDPPILTADSAFVVDAKRAVDSLYNVRYNSARRIFSTWKSRYPNHPIWGFWKGMITWWHILPDLQNRSLDDSLFTQLERTSRYARDILDRQPGHRDALLIHALSKGLIARQYANREKWFKSINQARHAINALKNLDDLQVHIPDLMLGRGLLQYYAAYLPEAYPVIRPFSWMLPQGNKQRGLKLMKRAADSSIYMRPEARYFLGKIYMNHEHKPRTALPFMKQLYEQYTRNPYYARQYVRALVQANQDDQALEVIDSIQSRSYGQFEPVVNEEVLAWRGNILYQRRELEQAEQSLLESYLVAPRKQLPEGTDRPFHTMAGYYLGRVYEGKADTSKAVVYYRSVSEAGPATSYSKRAAERVKALK